MAIDKYCRIVLKMPTVLSKPGGKEGDNLPEPRGTLRASDETHCFVLEMDDSPTPIEVANYR